MCSCLPELALPGNLAERQLPRNVLWSVDRAVSNELKPMSRRLAEP